MTFSLLRPLQIISCFFLMASCTSSSDGTPTKFDDPVQCKQSLSALGGRIRNLDRSCRTVSDCMELKLAHPCDVFSKTVSRKALQQMAELQKATKAWIANCPTAAEEDVCYGDSVDCPEDKQEVVVLGCVKKRCVIKDTVCK